MRLGSCRKRHRVEVPKARIGYLTQSSVKEACEGDIIWKQRRRLSEVYRTPREHRHEEEIGLAINQESAYLTGAVHFLQLKRGQ
jgi:hypothetical protein